MAYVRGPSRGRLKVAVKCLFIKGAWYLLMIHELIVAGVQDESLKESQRLAS